LWGIVFGFRASGPDSRETFPPAAAFSIASEHSTETEFQPRSNSDADPLHPPIKQRIPVNRHRRSPEQSEEGVVGEEYDLAAAYASGDEPGAALQTSQVGFGHEAGR